VEIDARLPSHVGVNPYSASYLEAKRLRMGHVLPEELGASPARRAIAGAPLVDLDGAE
jgi:GTP cyclohydrolase II